MKIEVMRSRSKAVGYRLTRRAVIEGESYRYGIIDNSGKLIAAYNCRSSVWIHLRKLSAEQLQPLL